MIVQAFLFLILGHFHKIQKGAWPVGQDIVPLGHSETDTRELGTQEISRLTKWVIVVERAHSSRGDVSM